MPLDRQASLDDEPDLSEHRPLRGVRLLVTCSHALLLDALIAYFERRGAEAVGAGEDPESLETLALAHEPDVCIFEQPRDTDGPPEVVARLRRRLPEVKLLGLGNHPQRPTAKAAVLDACLPGRQGLELLEDTLLELLDRPRRSPQRGAGSTPLPVTPVAHPDLSAREDEVLRLLVLGASTGHIAEQLGISVNTVRTHVQNLLQKLGKHRRVEAALLAFARSDHEARLALR